MARSAIPDPVSDTIPPEPPQSEDPIAELSLAARILALQETHRRLDDEIVELYERPFRDQLHLQRLKKKKLQIKDDIKRLQDDLIPDLNA